MTIMIFEDEIYNFRLLHHMLLEINPEYDVIGPISTVEEGRTFLYYHNDIDLIISDIQLNDGLSFDVLSYASEDIPIIFTTAYDEYALKAFEYCPEVAVVVESVIVVIACTHSHRWQHFTILQLTL